MVQRIAAISDYCIPLPVKKPGLGYAHYRSRWRGAADATISPASGPPTVRGGYLERLPLSAVRAGLAESAEIWSFAGNEEERHETAIGDTPLRRSFRADGPAPYASADLLAHLDIV